MHDFKVPDRHKAVVYSNPGTLTCQVVDVDTPAPGPGEVLLRLTHSGVCHTDYAFIMNSYEHMPEPTPAGQIGGHEGVGYVVQLGEGVSNVKLGDRLGVKWVTSTCLTCDQCNAGFDSRCAKRRVSGYKTPGTFQQYVVTDPQYATPIPDGLSSAAAAPLLCGGVTVWSSLMLADCKLGDWIAISGAGGGLGHLGVQYAKAFGLRVVAIDHGSKGEFLNRIGADAFFDFTRYEEKELAEEIKAVTGGGCHAILICNASSRVYDNALNYLRYAGTLVCVGIPEVDPHPIKNSAPFRLIMNQWRIKGAVTGNRLMAIDCLQPACLGQVQPTIAVESPNNLNQIFERLHRGEINGRVVLDLEKFE